MLRAQLKERLRAVARSPSCSSTNSVQTQQQTLGSCRLPGSGGGRRGSGGGAFHRTSMLLFSLVDQPTQGGSVPIYSKYNGRIVKRNWVFRNPNWCSMCKEPIAMWVNHMGRKDHSLLDHMYSALVDFPRNWDPEVLFHTYGPLLNGVPLESYQGKFGRYDTQRRTELLGMLIWLGDRGVVSFGDPRNTYLTRLCGSVMGMNMQAELAFRRFLMGPLLKLFPHGEIQNYSNFIDFVVCAYNLETIYDLNGFSQIDILSGGKHVATSPAASGLGGLSTANTASTHSYSSDPEVGKGGHAKGPSEAEAQEAFSRKASFVRSIIGQLRWAATEWKEHPQGRKFDDHVVYVTELCCQYLIAEALTCRLCEYAVRTEPMWREHGMERVKLDVGQRLREGLENDEPLFSAGGSFAPQQQPTVHHSQVNLHLSNGGPGPLEHVPVTTPQLEQYCYRPVRSFGKDMYYPVHNDPGPPNKEAAPKDTKT